jgi:glutathione S-transferase
VVVDVDLTRLQHKSEDFLILNTLGQVPVLIDGDLILADSNAILVYLAKAHGRTDWLPEGPAEAAAVQRWLSIAAGPIASGPAAARQITLFGARIDPDETIAKAHAILRVIEQELSARPFLAGEHPTIADVAIYSYVALAPEGNVSLAEYLNLRRWLTRIENLPGFVAPQTTPVVLAAAS